MGGQGVGQAIPHARRDRVDGVNFDDIEGAEGGVISPLLSNIYLHWFEVLAAKEARRTSLKIELVRYADDFVE